MGLTRYSQRSDVGARGPALSGADGSEAAATGAASEDRAMIRTTAERPRLRRILRSDRRDGIISNLLGEWCLLITTRALEGQSVAPGKFGT
jgi:hypothetical protein